MDQNDSTQDNTTAAQPTDMSQSNAPQTDQTQDTTVAPSQDTPTTQEPTAAIEPVGDQTQPTDQPTPDAPATDTPATAAPQAANYIEDVGGDMIGLLDEINADESLIQEVADEMQLDKEKVKSILGPLLDKIDQGQLTAEEIALIMAATVADELTQEEAK